MRGSQFAELNAFVAVARERSFRRAAQRLGLSPSALSHTIRALEQRLGLRLLHRTTRSVAPTEAGLALFTRLEAAFGDIQGALAEASAAQETPSGTLRLSVPRMAADLVLQPLLGRFLRAHPQVRLELAVDDGFTDVVAEGFDAGIRPGESVQADMVAVRLTPELPMAVVAAPAWLATHPAPTTPRELAGHTCIGYRYARTGALHRWRFTGPDGSLDVDVQGALTVDDTRLMRAAAVQGCGLAYLPRAFVQRELDAGTLLSLLQPWCRPAEGFFLYYPGRRQPPAALRALIDFLRPRDTLPHAG